MKPSCILSVSLTMLVMTSAALAGSADPLPAKFRHARVFLAPETANGETLEFYTDTGGGFNAITRSAAERASLEPEPAEPGDTKRLIADFPAFREGREIPPPGPFFMDGRLAVVDDSVLDEDGFLGGRWFANRVWEFDYPAETLRLLHGWQAPEDAAHCMELGFQVDADGERTLHFPRMPATIDGETMDMLLDTGATTVLSETGGQAYGLPAGTAVAASYITESKFAEWVKRHPDWQVIEDGAVLRGRSYPMIRVPEITIAGHVIGPVWFTRRPDNAFHEYMAQWMDAPIEGAIGGSAFRYFRMVIDYPAATACFFTD
ncbi:MAG TPA: hypothetical protein VF267_00640 [Gammaproteobacteria bacterium]